MRKPFLVCYDISDDYRRAHVHKTEDRRPH